MKTINAYLNIHNGKVVASTMEKPDEGDYIIWDDSLLTRIQLGIAQIDGFDNEGWENARAASESSILGDVENVWFGELSEKWFVDIEDVNSVVIKLNHPCQVEVGDKVTVISLTPAAG